LTPLPFFPPPPMKFPTDQSPAYTKALMLALSPGISTFSVAKTTDHLLGASGLKEADSRKEIKITAAVELIRTGATLEKNSRTYRKRRNRHTQTHLLRGSSQTSQTLKPASVLFRVIRIERLRSSLT
jgi:hypothetical protein